MSLVMPRTAASKLVDVCLTGNINTYKITLPLCTYISPSPCPSPSSY